MSVRWVGRGVVKESRGVCEIGCCKSGGVVGC